MERIIGTMRAFATVVSLATVGPSLCAQSVAVEQHHRGVAREILKQLVETRTVTRDGTRTAADWAAQRLLQEGFPESDVHVVGPESKVGNVVARLRGNGSKRPLLLMAHLDVVEALREDWSIDPFTFLERDGFFYGRGTWDNKAGAAILITNMIRLRRERFVPDRDVIIVLTGDEETGGASLRWLLDQHRDLIDAEYALNTDAGQLTLTEGLPVAQVVQAGEKIYMTFELEVRNRGGHSSRPRKDNAIYQLVDALARLSRHHFPVNLNDATRTFFERSAELEKRSELAVAMRKVAAGDRASETVSIVEASPYYNGITRTTCVATQLSAGHAENALPQVARATVNCRILPQEGVDYVERVLRDVLNDEEIVLRRATEVVKSPVSRLTPDIIGPIERLTAQMFPDVQVVVGMSAYGTDGTHTRNAGIPTYGVSAIGMDPDDDRAHG
ncbi:M20/M25/M40 family metallo-hydrolase, partial [Acidobacteria bacterium AH-259-A15]|nr:M20/M25/M40 family metallo-hydrolase [Acidobacteria bacterium AH-259-A15]